MKYAFIESLHDEFASVKMYRWLDVSRSGYYRWLQREPSGRVHQRELVRAVVNDRYYEFNRIFGVRT